MSSIKLKYDKEVTDFYKNKIKPKPEEYYEMMSVVGTSMKKQREVNNIYKDAMNLYWERNWDEALNLFNKAKEIIPEDGPVNSLIERTLTYKDTPPGDTWQGEFVQTKK